MKEKILCAAIWFNDGIFYHHQPLNIKTGIVMCGYRHCSIFPQTKMLNAERIQSGILKEKEGFLTNLNRFVDREEAAHIIIMSNQKTKDSFNMKKLYSEDLY